MARVGAGVGVGVGVNGCTLAQWFVFVGTCEIHALKCDDDGDGVRCPCVFVGL